MNSEVEEAIQNVLAGQIDEFALIVRTYQPEVWRIAAFAMRDVAATEDIVQQAFVDAYSNLKRYRAGMDFGAWLRTVARNRVRKELRDRARRSARLRFYHERLEQRMGSDMQTLHRERVRTALAECRKGLSGDAAKAVELRYEKSLDFTAIAESLGRTVAAARQLLSRVRLTLKNCIEERTSRA